MPRKPLSSVLDTCGHYIVRRSEIPGPTDEFLKHQEGIGHDRLYLLKDDQTRKVLALAHLGPVHEECKLSAGDLRQEISVRSLTAFLPLRYQVTLRQIEDVIKAHLKGTADILRRDGSWNIFFLSQVSRAVVVVRWNDVCDEWCVRALRLRRASWAPTVRVFFRG